MFHSREDKPTETWGQMFADLAHGFADQSQGSQGHVLATDAPIAGPNHQLADMRAEIASEGIGALLDPAGAADRLAARRELASRFNVMPNGTVGIARQNQVTQEEFDRIAREYSDIRLGRTDLQFGARPANMSGADYSGFKTNAMSDIADVMQTESGRGLIESLAHAPLQDDGKSHRTTMINPYLDATGHLDPRNSGGGGNFGVSGHVEVAPGMTIAPGQGDFRSDAVMYHELTHAHHAIYNTWDGGTVGHMQFGGRDLQYDHGADANTRISQSEYQAVGLGAHSDDRFSENRYRYERSQIGALGVGARSTGAETDAAMTHRDQYAYTPGLVRTHPAHVP
jgi:hypothetical protein